MAYLKEGLGETGVEEGLAESDGGERFLEPVVELGEAFERRCGSVDAVVTGVGFCLEAVLLPVVVDQLAERAGGGRGGVGGAKNLLQAFSRTR